MRADAKNLLDRLGKSDFAYKEFTDRFSDLELWPLFETLLKDPRIFAAGTPSDTVTHAEPVRDTFERPQRTERFSDGFGRYETGEQAAAPAAPRRTQDVREMLRQLSDLGSKGEL